MQYDGGGEDGSDDHQPKVRCCLLTSLVFCFQDPYRRASYVRDGLHDVLGSVCHGHAPYDHDYHDVRAT